MPVVSSSPVTCLKILPSPYLSNHRPYALQVRASCMTLRYPIKPCEKADFFSFTWKVVFYFWDDICANLKKKKTLFSVMHYALNTWRRMNQIFLKEASAFFTLMQSCFEGCCFCTEEGISEGLHGPFVLSWSYSECIFYHKIKQLSNL